VYLHDNKLKIQKYSRKFPDTSGGRMCLLMCLNDKTHGCYHEKSTTISRSTNNIYFDLHRHLPYRVPYIIHSITTFCVDRPCDTSVELTWWHQINQLQTILYCLCNNMYVQMSVDGVVTSAVTNGTGSIQPHSCNCWASVIKAIPDWKMCN